MNELTDIQVRVLGCLIEKQYTTPDQYPLTLNSLRNACNQKTARYPVTEYSEGEVGHALRELESFGLVREEWGARAAKYEQLAGRMLGLTSKYQALLCVLMLRGPQTLGELRTHSHRMFAFDDLDDVEYAINRLIEHEPPLVVGLHRQPGQKEGRFAHLLAGEPDLPEPSLTPIVSQGGGLQRRVEELEAEIAQLRDRVAELESRCGD